MSGSAELAGWLASLQSAQLHLLLRRRPDAARDPEPQSLAELAGRLNSQHSVSRAIELLSLPALQAAEAMQAFGGSATRPELLRWLGVDEAAGAAVDRALDELLGLALVWPAGSAVRTSGAWAELLPDPLGLGRPGKILYQSLTINQLARIGSGLGLGGFHRKAEWVHALTSALADPEVVARRLQQAGPELAALVNRLAWDGPRVFGVRFPLDSGGTMADPVGLQLAVQGWVVPTEWDTGEMPREVALAVRGPGYHAPFSAEPPAPATAPVDPARLADAGRQAAGAAVQTVRRLLSLLERAPLATVQAGGIGVRELRRAGKLLGIDEPAVRLWLETMARAKLAARTSDALLTTTEAEGWLATDPGPALATLLLAWWQLPIVPGHRVDETGKALPAVSTGYYSHNPAARFRADVLEQLAGLGPGRGLVDDEALAGLLAFRRPVAAGGPDAVARLRATLAEAALLGLVAAGALTPLGRDLLAAADTDDPASALATAVAGLLPAPTRTATFLPDLTAVVPGSAAVELARLLDATAESETRDTASTWRFTPDSVRAALDAGHTADGLLGELAAVADNPLPQPLDYLVRDVARRHGQVQVFAVACCVRVADATLGAELAAHRALRPLGLRALADTVLASGKPVTETIAALRKAGYAPVRQDADGDTLVERTEVRRVEPRRRHGPPSIIKAPGSGLAALAGRLSGELPAQPVAIIDRRLSAEEVPHLVAAEVAVLAHAITNQRPVLIEYQNAAGNRSIRVVEPRMKLFGTLVAWCRSKQADRNFALERILAVGPAD